MSRLIQHKNVAFWFYRSIKNMLEAAKILCSEVNVSNKQ